MKNAIKVMAALKQALPGHRVENFLIDDNYDMQSIFVDGKCVGHFYADFFQHDFDNPEIAITVKAPLKNIKDFVDHANSYGIIRGAVERGLQEWQEESHPNS